MTPSSTTLVAAMTLAILATFGCGARTGLELGEQETSDADLGPAPDVFGPFPCTFSPVGESEPIRQGPQRSSHPSIEYGGGRLGILYRLDSSGGVGTAFCSRVPYSDDGCTSEISLGDDSEPYSLPLTWNGDGWGLCTQSNFVALSPFGQGAIIPHGIGSDFDLCIDLVHSDSRYICAGVNLSIDPMTVTIAALDQHGFRMDPPLHQHELEGATVLAAHDGMEIGAWAAPSWLVLRRLDGPGPYMEVMIEAENAIDDLDIALRRPITGVVSSELVGGARVVFFRLIDMERGQLVPPVELDRPANVSGLAVVAVNEGFVTAWSEWDPSGRDRVVVVPIGVDGWETSIYSEIVLYDEPHDPIFSDLGGPSLAYDDRAVFATFTRQVQSTGLYQAHFQQLDCHR